MLLVSPTQRGVDSSDRCIHEFGVELGWPTQSTMLRFYLLVGQTTRGGVGNSGANEPATETADRVLDIAEHLVQTLGFNGFSYADIARRLEITKPALHYHYPTKAILGVALTDRYTTRFLAALTAIDARPETARKRLEFYVAIYREVLARKRMCLCGMLAAEYETLPGPMREALARFFDHNELWLTETLERGRDADELHFDETANAAARAVVGTIEGAMLISRLHDDPTIFDTAVHRLLNGFNAQPPS